MSDTDERFIPAALSATDIAAELRVSERTARTMMADGTLPVVRVSKGIRRVRRTDFEDYLASLAVEAS